MFAIHQAAKISGTIINPIDANWQRTVIFIHTQNGQDMFVCGDIDHDYANTNLNRNCQTSNFDCAIPISHKNLLNETTTPWKTNERYLDWYDSEADQSSVYSA